jgi:hypothetical protein
MEQTNIWWPNATLFGFSYSGVVKSTFNRHTLYLLGGLSCRRFLKLTGSLLAVELSCYTVKRLDEVVRHPHLVTQDQFTQVSKKVSDIPAENFTINIELFRQTFANVELLRHSWKVSKAALPGR